MKDVIGKDDLKLLVQKIQIELDSLENKLPNEKKQFKAVKEKTCKALNYINTFNIGVNTTCGYSLLNFKANDIVHAYFLLNDYDSCMKIDNNIDHTFKAYAFGH